MEFFPCINTVRLKTNGDKNMYWWSIGAIVVAIIVHKFWKAYTHPSHVLGRQAANMNWVATGLFDDKSGYKNVKLRRDENEAYISYKEGKVFLLKPSNYQPFDDFISIERWLTLASDEAEIQRGLDFGYKISEFDIALETHQQYAIDEGIDVPNKGNGKNIYWNCYASLYASIYFAKQKSKLEVHSSIWNSIIHSIVVGMVNKESPNSIMGTPVYKKIESQAYNELHELESIISQSLKDPKPFLLEPVVDHILEMFGSYGNATAKKALGALLLINAKTAHEKLIPEYLHAFS